MADPPPPNTADILKHLTASAGGLSVYQLRDALGGEISLVDLGALCSISMMSRRDRRKGIYDR